MSKLLVDAPGMPEPLHIDLPDGQSVLLGRDPATARLPDGIPRDRAAAIPLPSPSVSANHALVMRDGERVTVLDLGSRNGTWLRAPAMRAAHTDAGAELRLQLAAAPAASRAENEPDDAHYTGRDDFGDALATAAARWLAQRGIRARVQTTRARVEGATCFRLASGGTLRITTDHTLDASAERALDALRLWVARHNSALAAEEETRGDGMILASPEIRAAHRAVVEAAQRGLPGLVFLGPTGAGKERLARAFHRHSDRGGPFVAINCSLLSRDLARADLFGAEVGAYTGCDTARVGAVERAHGGTLFLDEVGDMSLEVQALLLRFLDSGEFERMGSSRARLADVRVVCATNKDLRDAILRGQFREDLWWRLCVQVIEVPPLRRRFDDAVAYLRARRLGAVSAHDALSPEALEVLRAHSWNGNFRELTNLVARLPLASRPGELDAAAVRRALDVGTLARHDDPRPSTNPTPTVGWDDIARLAAAAFAEDHGRSAPISWADVATFVEQYLKPVAVQRMVDPLDADAPLRETAQRLQADTKTVAKHLGRFADRFTR